MTTLRLRTRNGMTPSSAARRHATMQVCGCTMDRAGLSLGSYSYFRLQGYFSAIRQGAARLESDRRLLKRICLLIFLWACAVRLVSFLAVDRFIAAEEKKGEMYNVARTIAERGEFSDPYREKMRTGPTAHVPPLYAYVLAAQIRLAPNEMFFRYANSLLAALAISLLWGCLPWVSARLELGATAGVVAGLYGASNPFAHWLDFEGVWDQNYTALGLALLLAYCFRRLRPVEPLRYAAVAGVLWGALILTQPSTCMALCAFCLARFLCHGIRRRAILVRLAIMVLLAAAVILPWTIRTRVVLGGWVPLIRSNFPLELALSFRDGAQPLLFENLFQPGIRHPHLNMEEAKLAASMGEFNYMKSRKADALAWIRAHPLGEGPREGCRQRGFLQFYIYFAFVLRLKIGFGYFVPERLYATLNSFPLEAQDGQKDSACIFRGS